VSHDRPLYARESTEPASRGAENDGGRPGGGTGEVSMRDVKEVVLKDWDTFEGELSRFFDSHEKRKAATKLYISTPLFRGHADSRWHLLTTLERFSRKPHSITEYFRTLISLAPAVASLTTKAWPVDPDLKFDESYIGPPPGYEFMIYLRHHGFPSPLLDWSRSPYVAAFFAFAPTFPEDSKTVAIYAYVEHLGHGKMRDSGQGRIIGLGPYAVTHERHYTQLSEYTICKKPVGNSYLYCNHEEGLGDTLVEADSLTKYVIPGSERNKFLARLDLMNINAYSLFRDETSLMQTLAYREIKREFVVGEMED